MVSEANEQEMKGAREYGGGRAHEENTINEHQRWAGLRI